MKDRRLVIAGLVVLASAALLLITRRPSPPRIPAPPVPQAPTAPPATTLPATPTPHPPQIVDRNASFTVPWGAGPTPEPTLTPPPPERRRPPPTPAVHECVGLRYSAGVLPGSLGRILVDVQLENHCGRDLAPLEVWFWAGGYRHGELIQGVSGHPFDPIARDSEGKASIVLPGSIDWYDRIEVRLIPADAR